ncbi:MAG: 3-deoxy-7-phosphoheptulonate synthase, partial [Acidobacteria bacterium]|nr:3-deoxy-7-phosphoheptulonate synthase [Acidobacteriota bacterium]
MILILTPNIDTEGETYRRLMAHLSRLQNIQARVHREQGAAHCLTEIHLIGNTASVSLNDMRNLPGVEHAVRISEEYRVVGRHEGDQRPTHFDYKGVRFGQDTLNVFAGLCAVDEPRHVELMMRALRDNGQVCTRMGAYKPRTSAYTFQGH